MPFYPLLKVLHIFAAFWLTAGIIGRQLVRFRARRTEDITEFVQFSNLAGKFERRMVIPGNTIVILLGVILAILGGWPIFGFLQGSGSNWLLVSNLILLVGMFLVPFVYLPRRKRFDVALEKAVAKGRVTAELNEVMDDLIVRLAHRWEFIGLFIVFMLMIFKPI